jgi:hypothetical protein
LQVSDGIYLRGIVLWARSNRIGIKLDHPLTDTSILRLADEQTPLRTRRRSPRLGIGASAWLGTGMRRYPIRLLDISPAGAMIGAKMGVPGLGSIQLEVPGLPRIGAQIRWVDDSRAGLMFNRPLRLDVLAAWLDTYSATHVQPSARTYENERRADLAGLLRAI